jgi:hypothetical protein
VSHAPAELNAGRWVGRRGRGKRRGAAGKPRLSKLSAVGSAPASARGRAVRGRPEPIDELIVAGLLEALQREGRAGAVAQQPL